MGSVGFEMLGYLVALICLVAGVQGRPIRSIPSDIYLKLPIENFNPPPIVSTTPVFTALISTTTTSVPDIYLNPALVSQTGGEEEETPSFPTFNTFTPKPSATMLPGNTVTGDAEMASKSDQDANGFWSMMPTSWRLFLRGKQ